MALTDYDCTFTNGQFWIELHIKIGKMLVSVELSNRENVSKFLEALDKHDFTCSYQDNGEYVKLVHFIEGDLISISCSGKDQWYSPAAVTFTYAGAKEKFDDIIAKMKE